MQTLSTWPCTNELLLVPEWDIEFCPCKSKCTSKRLFFVASFLHLRSDFHLQPSCSSISSRFNGVSGRCKSVVFLDKISSFAKIDNDCNKEKEKEEEIGREELVGIVKNGNVDVRKQGLHEKDEEIGREELVGIVKNVNVDVRKRGLREKDEEIGRDELVVIGKNARVDVRKLGLCLQLATTADDVEEVLKTHGQLPLQVFSSLIRGLGKDQKIDSVIALFEWLMKRSQESDGKFRLNLYIYNSFLGAFKQAQRYDHVDRIINQMLVEGLQPNVITCNTLMAIYIEQGKEVEALNLFEEISRKGLCPTPASYSTVLLAYRGIGDAIGAIKFFVEVKDKHRKGEIEMSRNEDWDNEITKLENFTIRMCFQVMRHWLVNCENRRTDILRVLTEMDKAGLQPSRADYERLVWACTSQEHYVVAKELYSRIRERDSEISLSVCNHVIWLMGKAKKWWAALEIYEDLLDRGPEPNNMSYELIFSHFNILLTAAKRRGIWRWGVQLLDKMEEKGLKPGSKEWNSVLVACSKASETYAAVDIFKRMVEKGEKPTIISYGALLSALEKGKLYNEALQVWEHMTKVGVPPNLYTYTIMASVYTALGRFNIVDSIIKEMLITGIVPTVVTFNAIISGCARNNKGHEAYEWFQRMKNDHNLTPDNVTYEMLIEALCKDGKPRLVYDLYISATNEGLNLSSKAYDLAIHSSQMYGAAIDMSSLGTRPAEKKKRRQLRKTLPE